MTSFTKYDLETTGDPEACARDGPFEVNANIDRDPHTLPPSGDVEHGLEGIDETTQAPLSNEPNDFGSDFFTADGSAGPSGETG